MSYAIGYVIYGVVLNDECRKILQLAEENTEIWEVLEPFGEYGGFETLYSAGGPMSGYCGVLLATIDECSTVHLDSANWKANPEEKKQALEKVLGLYPPLREAVGVAGHYIVWGSS